MVRRAEATAYAGEVMANIRWGIRYGVIFAAFYCATALAIFAVEGSGAFSRYDITLGRTLASYVLGGILGGATLGLLRPLTRYWAGSACVGVFAALPVAWILAHAMGVVDSKELVFVVGACSLGWGIPGGLIMHRIFSRRRPTKTEKLS